LIAIALVALVCWWFLPFEPTITFANPKLSEYGQPDGTTTPLAIIEMTNVGRESVWYNGRGREVASFSYYSIASNDHAELNGYHCTPVYWTRLKHGQSTFIRIPTQNVEDAMRIEVELKDWRGRSVVRSSDRLRNPASN